ncbi:hypothetical protein O4H52_08345 [Sphingomonadaceae bacterium G21617-S1]|nr:hypothetical protein [Sphingomonadaceae bacterium G21617-S1]TAK09447.1 MAG: hypothetical protein EPO38_09485 [Rhizorhabdus sp.]
MQFKIIIATASVALSLASLAQPAHARNRASGPVSSDARIEAMMRTMDRFQARQNQIERSSAYAERQRLRGEAYAARSTRDPRR